MPPAPPLYPDASFDPSHPTGLPAWPGMLPMPALPWYGGELITHDQFAVARSCAAVGQPIVDPLFTTPAFDATFGAPSTHPSTSAPFAAFDFGDIYMPAPLLPAPPPAPVATAETQHVCASCGPSCTCGPTCRCGHVAALEETLAHEEGGDEVWQGLLASIGAAPGPAHADAAGEATTATMLPPELLALSIPSPPPQTIALLEPDGHRREAVSVS